MKQPNRPKNNKNTLSSVRIIGGEYRRRQVQFIDADGLRPTPDRLRETLFNWLMPYITNANVLDCCAGSGVLGFEALSRGAKQVVMIEPNHQQYQQLQHTANTLQLTSQQLQLYHQYAEQILDKIQQKFDIIFLDPPYHANLWQILLEKMTILMDNKSILYIEADRSHQQIFTDQIYQQLSPIKQGKFGNIWASLYQFDSV